MFVDNFKDLADSCVSFYEESKDKISLDRVQAKRDKLSGFAEAFHEDCGTLTGPVQKRLEDLRNGKCVILMTAHQPNFFAYGGVLRKATLNFVLAKTLEKILKVPVVNFFGIADQDFTDDRWVRSCELPAVQRSGGILSIEAKLPEKLTFNKVPKPSPDLLSEWKSEIEKWLNEAIGSIRRLCRKLGLQEEYPSSIVSVLHGNLASFWKTTEDCWKRSKTYSDFNGFLMSSIVNDAWGYDTVFARFSECQQAFTDEFCFLLSHFKDYSRLLKEAKEMSHGEDLEGGVSDQEPYLAPFWYHCSCGSKVKLFLEEKDGSLFGSGNCVRCQEHYELDFGNENNPDILEIASQISARAIPMGLVFFKGLQPSCYVGGVGGATYLMEAKHVARGLAFPFPPVAVWRPRDRYLGVGQIEALLELKGICKHLGVKDASSARHLLESNISDIRRRLGELEESKRKLLDKLKGHPDDMEVRHEIKRVSMSQSEIVQSSNLSVVSHELKILENVSIVSALMPSIIDYAVSVGLRDTSDQWLQYLSENGNLSSDVHVKAIANRNLKSDVIFKESLELF
jgi:hypothetical protein